MRAHYNIHKVRTGLYTKGNEFTLPSGKMYVGAYHELPNGEFWTKFVPEIDSLLLTRVDRNASEDVLSFNRVRTPLANNYINPVSYYPQPTIEEINSGVMERFFVQKRNNPLNTIHEIDVEQYNSINTENKVGINGVLWKGILLYWRISKYGREVSGDLNRKEIIKASRIFPGIATYLRDVLELYKH